MANLKNLSNFNALFVLLCYENLSFVMQISFYAISHVISLAVSSHCFAKCI